MKETSYRENPRKEIQLPTTWDRIIMWMRNIGYGTKKGFYRILECIFTHPHLVLCAVAVGLVVIWIQRNTDPVGECYFRMELGTTHVYVTEPLGLDRAVAVVYVEGDDLKQNRDVLQIVRDIGCKFRP